MAMAASEMKPAAAGAPGGPAPGGQALAIGTRLDEFEIVGYVGEGGFSIVYLAMDHSLRRKVAIKEYLPGVLAGRRGDNTVAVRSEQDRETFETGLVSFMNEARLLAQFDHPALVRVHRFWEANGTAYMAMPYYQGRTLKELVAEQPKMFTEARLKELFAPILASLEVLHEHHCYHRDVSPDNILVQANGAAVLLDFGAARRSILGSAQAFTVILKPGFAPVEQYADDGDLKQGPWTDVYAVAAVLYMTIVGKAPPTSVGRAISDPCEPLARRHPPGFSAGFLAGIDRGLRVRPEERPRTIGELRRLLGIAVTPSTPPAPGPAAHEAAFPVVEPPESGNKRAEARPGSSEVDDERTVIIADKSASGNRFHQVEAAPSAQPRIARKWGAVTAAIIALPLVAGAAAWVYLGNHDWGRPTAALSTPGVQGPAPGQSPQAISIEPATRDQSSAGAGPSLPESQRQPEPQPPDTHARTPPPPTQRSIPVEKVTAAPAGAGAGTRKVQENRAPGTAATSSGAQSDRAPASSESGVAPSKEKCREWQIRVILGELLSPEERSQFNTRCQL